MDQKKKKNGSVDPGLRFPTTTRPVHRDNLSVPLKCQNAVYILWRTTRLKPTAPATWLGAAHDWKSCSPVNLFTLAPPRLWTLCKHVGIPCHEITDYTTLPPPPPPPKKAGRPGSVPPLEKVRLYISSSIIYRYTVQQYANRCTNVFFYVCSVTEVIKTKPPKQKA